RRLLATVYADGNNFGSVVKKLDTLSRHLQWTHRVEATTQAAAALALGVGTQQAASVHGWEPGGAPKLTKLPVRTPARGGDDVGLGARRPVVRPGVRPLD